MKNPFKWIKKKIAIVAVMACLLSVGVKSYWAFERKGYEQNIETISQALDHVVYAGDPGEANGARDEMIKVVANIAPTRTYYLGDLGYPNGVKNASEYIKWIRPLLSDQWISNCLLGNHDGYADNITERNWMALNSDRLGCRFLNYYRGEIFTNACQGIYDSSIYYLEPIIKKSLISSDEKRKQIEDINEKIKNQEKFLTQFFNDPRCKDKAKFLLGHHTLFTYGPHAKDTDGRHLSFVLSLNIDVSISGHDHLFAFTSFKNKLFYVTGSFSQLSKCKYSPEYPNVCISKHGVLWLHDARFDFVSK